MRLGHAPHHVLNHISCIGKFAGCNSTCPICPYAKQTMLPFPKHSDSYDVETFDLLHIDVRGPYHVATTTGCKYFRTIVDDHSRATWTFFMCSKQNVFSYFKIL